MLGTASLVECWPVLGNFWKQSRLALGPKAQPSTWIRMQFKGGGGALYHTSHLLKTEFAVTTSGEVHTSGFLKGLDKSIPLHN